MSINRTKTLARAVSYQKLAQDRAQAQSASLRRQSAALGAQADVLTQSAVADSPVHDLLVASIARRLASIAKQQARLDERAATADATANRHASLARAGEKRLVRLTADEDAVAARRDLEALSEAHVGRVSLR